MGREGTLLTTSPKVPLSFLHRKFDLNGTGGVLDRGPCY